MIGVDCQGCLELEDEEEEEHQVVLELEDVECSVVLGFCYDRGFAEEWIGSLDGIEVSERGHSVAVSLVA